MPNEIRGGLKGFKWHCGSSLIMLEKILGNVVLGIREHSRIYHFDAADAYE